VTDRHFLPAQALKNLNSPLLRLLRLGGIIRNSCLGTLFLMNISTLGSQITTKFYGILANRAPALPGKLIKHFKGTHLDILRHTKFSLPRPFGFWSLGYPGVQGLGWRGHTCVKKLP